MWIKKEYDYNDLKNNSWSGAIDTLNRIEDADQEEELMSYLEEIFNENIPTDTEVNDFLRFEADMIYRDLDIADEDEDEVIEDEEVTSEDLNNLIK